MDKSNPPGGGRVGSGPPSAEQPGPAAAASKPAAGTSATSTLASNSPPPPSMRSTPPPSGSLADSPEQIARRLDRVRVRAPYLASSLEFTMYLATKTGLPALRELEEMLVRMDERVSVPGLTVRSPVPPRSPRPVTVKSSSRPPPKGSAVSLRPARTAVSMRVSGGSSGMLIVALAAVIAFEVIGLVWIWIKTS